MINQATRTGDTALLCISRCVTCARYPQRCSECDSTEKLMVASHLIDFIFEKEKTKKNQPVRTLQGQQEQHDRSGPEKLDSLLK